MTGASTTVTASFLQNSAGSSLTAGQIPALIGLPVTWANAVDGTVSGQQTTIQSGGAATATFTAGTTPGINAGKLEAEVDAVQNGDTMATASITIYQPPTVTSTNATTFAVGASGTFTVTATGFPAPNLSLSGALPSGVGFNSGTGVLSGTPGAGAGGIYPLVITATSAAGTNTQNFTLTVDQAPAISSANNATFTAGSAGSFAVTAGGFPVPALGETGLLPAGSEFHERQRPSGGHAGVRHRRNLSAGLRSHESGSAPTRRISL